MPVPWRRQWLTSYLAMGGMRQATFQDFLAIVGPEFRGIFEAPQEPNIDTRGLPLRIERERIDESTIEERIVVTSGPYEGMIVAAESLFTLDGEQPETESALTPDYTIMSAMKWNIHYRGDDEMTSAFALELRRQTATRVRERARAIGFHVTIWSLAPYGEALSSDRGVPQAPPLPPEPRAETAPTVPVAAAGTRAPPWGLLAILAAVGAAGLRK